MTNLAINDDKESRKQRWFSLAQKMRARRRCSSFASCMHNKMQRKELKRTRHCVHCYLVSMLQKCIRVPINMLCVGDISDIYYL